MLKAALGLFLLLSGAWQLSHTADAECLAFDPAKGPSFTQFFAEMPTGMGEEFVMPKAWEWLTSCQYMHEFPNYNAGFYTLGLMVMNGGTLAGIVDLEGMSNDESRGLLIAWQVYAAATINKPWTTPEEEAMKSLGFIMAREACELAKDCRTLADQQRTESDSSLDAPYYEECARRKRAFLERYKHAYKQTGIPETFDPYASRMFKALGIVTLLYLRQVPSSE